MTTSSDADQKVPIEPAPSRKAKLIAIAVVTLIVLVGVGAALGLPRALAQGAANLSCLDDRLDGFFDAPAATEDEVAFQTRVEDYATRLAGFACDQGYQLATAADPMRGSWAGEEGLFTFEDDAFRWSVALQDDDTEYYFAGDYIWLPGCEFDDVLAMERRDRPCSTVFLRYDETMSSDVLTNDVYYGGLMIAQDADTDIYVSMFNMRTGGSFYVDRLE